MCVCWLERSKSHRMIRQEGNRSSGQTLGYHYHSTTARFQQTMTDVTALLLGIRSSTMLCICGYVTVISKSELPKIYHD